MKRCNNDSNDFGKSDYTSSNISYSTLAHLLTTYYIDHQVSSILGSGKTQVAVSIILAAVTAGENVLVVAETNIAVDNITRRLIRAGAEHLVRLGKTDKWTPT